MFSRILKNLSKSQHFAIKASLFLDTFAYDVIANIARPYYTSTTTPNLPCWQRCDHTFYLTFSGALNRDNALQQLFTLCGSEFVVSLSCSIAFCFHRETRTLTLSVLRAVTVWIKPTNCVIITAGNHVKTVVGVSAGFVSVNYCERIMRNKWRWGGWHFWGCCLRLGGMWGVCRQRSIGAMGSWESLQVGLLRVMQIFVCDKV